MAMGSTATHQLRVFDGATEHGRALADACRARDGTARRGVVRRHRFLPRRGSVSREACRYTCWRLACVCMYIRTYVYVMHVYRISCLAHYASAEPHGYALRYNRPACRPIPALFYRHPFFFFSFTRRPPFSLPFGEAENRSESDEGDLPSLLRRE